MQRRHRTLLSAYLLGSRESSVAVLRLVVVLAAVTVNVLLA